MPGWNWQKIKQKLSNTLRINFRFLTIIHFLHPLSYPKILGEILKKYKKQVRLFNKVIWLMRLKI